MRPTEDEDVISIEAAVSRIAAKLVPELPHAESLCLSPGRRSFDGLDFVPDALRKGLFTLLQVADGQTADAVDLELQWLPHAERLFSGDEMGRVQAEALQWFKEDEEVWELDGGRVLSWLRHPARIQFAGNPDFPSEGGLFVDGVPGPAGTAGQVIVTVSECDFKVLAPSLTAFFHGMATLLENGGLVVTNGAYGPELTNAAGEAGDAVIETLRAHTKV